MLRCAQHEKDLFFRSLLRLEIRVEDTVVATCPLGLRFPISDSDSTGVPEHLAALFLIWRF